MYIVEPTACPTNLDGWISSIMIEEQNSKLCELSFDKKIMRASFEMNEFKPLRPDGFSRIFYKFYWQTIKEDLL